MEKLLPSNNNNDDSNDSKKKKKKKPAAVLEINKPIVLTEAELEKTRKDIKKLKGKLASLEADWDFDKNTAQEIYTEKLKVIVEKKRKEQIEAQAQLKKKQKEEEEEAAAAPALKTEETDKTDGQEDEDEEGGLFGGLMMDEEEEAAIMANTTASATSISWNIIDLSVPKSYVGTYPKDIMLEHCNKQKLGRLSYNATNEGPGIWRATLKIVKEGYSNISLKFELPDAVGTESKQDAMQLIAVSDDKFTEM